MAPAVPKQSRPKLIQVLFRCLDDDSTGHLREDQLRRFADCCGFSDSGADWAAEFREVCALYGWDIETGPDLRQFGQLVNDRNGIGYSTDAELCEIIKIVSTGGAEDRWSRAPHRDALEDDAASETQTTRRSSNASFTPTAPSTRLGSLAPGSPDFDRARSASPPRPPAAAPAPAGGGAPGQPRRESSAPVRGKTPTTPPVSASHFTSPSPPELYSPTPNAAGGVGPESPQLEQRPSIAARQGVLSVQLGPPSDLEMSSSPSSPWVSMQTAPPATWGGYAEGQETTLSKPLAAFVDWASHHWDKIHELFTAEDRHQYVVKGAIGRKGPTAAEWARKLREMGFQGNAKAVFDEIAAECQNDKEDRRQMARPSHLVKRAARCTIAMESISLSQLKRFEHRLAAASAQLSPNHDSSAVSRFTKLLMQQRGSLLRAWRLDLDIRGSGRVAFVDFAHACRRLGVASQARPIWSSLRQKEDSRPLEFAELAREEGANLEAFTATLWTCFGFDLEKAWTFLDVNCQHWLSLEEFESGARKLEFDGDTRLLFRGLDTSGLGRVWHNEFNYLRTVTRVGPRKLQQSAGPIADFIQWVQRQLGGVRELITLLGLSREHQDIKIGDLVVRLAALGFEGDALQAASLIARQDGGASISVETLTTLFASNPAPAPFPGDAPRLSSPPRSRARGRQQPQQVWQDAVEDFTATNRTKPKGQKNYFSTPERENQDFSPAPRTCRSASTSTLLGRPTAKPVWNPGHRRPDSKPAWNDGVSILSSVNVEVPACRRQYFSDPSTKPVREAMKTRMERSQSARTIHEVSLRPSGSPGAPPLERFARFVASRFGSPEAAFRKLDADGSGLLRHRDFNLQVQRAGYTDNPNLVFQQLDGQKRGALSLRDFTAGLQLPPGGRPIEDDLQTF